jgi:hypothetical protein
MVLLASLNCFGASAFAAGFDPPANGWVNWEVPAVAGQTTDTVRIYAHFTGGKVDRLRPLSADCAIELPSAVRSISLSEQTSVEWLESLMFKDSDPRIREHAAFGLGQIGRPNTEEAINKALRAETNRDVRDQEIFALSRLPEERATRALIGTAQDKALPQEDRKRAIFWLAQSGSDSALAYLDKVLAVDGSR